MHEIFAWQDKLDAIEDEPEKAWELFNDFLNECEDQLELNPEFIKQLDEAMDEDCMPLNMEYETNLFDDELPLYTPCKKSDKYTTDIPFSPRHDF